MLIPTAAATLWLAYQDLQKSVAAARQGSLALARLAAASHDRFLRDSEHILRQLALRPGIRALDPARCDPRLRDFDDILPMFVNVSVARLDGVIVCSVIAWPAGLTLAQHPWFAALRDAPGLYVTEPFRSRVAERWVLLLSYPVRDANDRVAGRVNLVADLMRFQDFMATLHVPPGTVMTLLSPEGALLARMPPLPQRIGASARDTDVVARELAGGEDMADATGLDGVRRLYGFAQVAASGWHVHAGVPAELVLGPVYRTAGLHAVLYAAGAGLLLLFLRVWYRRVDRDLRDLARVASAVERGDWSARFHETGSREQRDIVRTLNIMLDARGRAEGALRQSEAQQRELARHLEAERARLAEAQAVAGVGSWELDLRSGRLSWSEQVYRIFGMDPAHFGASYEAFIGCVHPDDRERVLRANSEALAGGGAYAIEHRIVRPDRVVRFVREQGRVFADDAGVAQRFVGTVQDITESRRAETALRESEERFRQLAENISEVFWVARPAMQGLLYVSPAYEKIWERSRADLYESPQGWLEAVHPDDRERVQQALKEQAAGRYDVSYRIVQPSGALRWIRDRAFPVRNEKSEVYRIVGIAADITDAKAWEQQFERSYRRLRSLAQRLNEVRDQEWKHVSSELHDRIGQNLAALAINMNLLRDEWPADSARKVARRLEESLKLVEHTSATVRDLITELRPADLDAYGLLAALRGLGQQMAARAGVEIGVNGLEPQPRLPPGTENALYRIAQEALTNAVKHARAQTLRMRLEQGPGEVVLSVEDDGVGFDVAAREAEGGRHWGLAIMQERAEAVGASLLVESAPGHGTRVTVRLPMPP